MITLSEFQNIKLGAVILYNDGRPGHTDARATVESVTPAAIVVQFEDRADTTTIRANDAAWLNHLSMARTADDIAAAFGCTSEQVGNQFAKNHAQLTSMYNQACATGKRVNGYTSEQLRQIINSLPMGK